LYFNQRLLKQTVNITIVLAIY